MELVDYKDGSITFFDGKPDDDGSDDGMGECKGVSLFSNIYKKDLFILLEVDTKST